MFVRAIQPATHGGLAVRVDLAKSAVHHLRCIGTQNAVRTIAAIALDIWWHIWCAAAVTAVFGHPHQLLWRGSRVLASCIRRMYV